LWFRESRIVCGIESFTEQIVLWRKSGCGKDQYDILAYISRCKPMN
jgi:hypothetical protein